jgi:DNA-3-methyladenine glycosylase
VQDTYIFGERLAESFFLREDVVQVSQDLLGKHLVTCFDGHLTVGRIVETEAYRAPEDKASHAYGNRLTARTEVMFKSGGHAYIYLCYGIHHLFNVVTAPQGMAHAVLVRAIEPVHGIDTMLQRRQMLQLKPALSAGPGTASQALGLNRAYTGQFMLAEDSPFWIETPVVAQSIPSIRVGPRIGVAYAKECALWPWRFFIEGNPWVSRVKSDQNPMR